MDGLLCRSGSQLTELCDQLVKQLQESLPKKKNNKAWGGELTSPQYRTVIALTSVHAWIFLVLIICFKEEFGVHFGFGRVVERKYWIHFKRVKTQWKLTCDEKLCLLSVVLFLFVCLFFLFIYFRRTLVSKTESALSNCWLKTNDSRNKKMN